MSEEIKGKCYQEHEPTPDKPCEIKTIVCNDIEIPVEFLEQNFVTVDGKKYIEIQQENKQLKEKLKGVQEERDYLVNKQSIENNYLAIENQQLKDKIKQLEKCYCNRSDCSGRIKDSRKYDSVVQQLDKYKEVIEEIEKFITENKKKVYHNSFIDDDCDIEICLNETEIRELENIIIKAKEGDYNG